MYIRHALRACARAPMHTTIVVLTLALGIGAATTAHGVIDPLLLRALPFAEPARLITLADNTEDDGAAGVLQGEHAILRENVRAFEQLALYRSGIAWGIADALDAERVTGASVTPDFFGTLGVDALHGDVRAPEAGADALVVLSHALWQRRYGGDPAIIGNTVRLDGRALTVAAVMRPRFDFPDLAELWLVQPVNAADIGGYWGTGGYRVVGRLARGASAQRAQAEVRALSAAMSNANPLWTPRADYRTGLRVVPLQDAVIGSVRTPLLLLGGAVALLLLIACANVANLVLVRALDRSREMAVRAALGAGSGRIMRHLVTETVVLAVMGGAAGAAVAYGAVALLRTMLPPDLPRLAEVGIDPRVLAVTLLLTLATGVLLGVVPALRARRASLRPAFGEGNRAIGNRSTQRLSHALVVTQVALAVLLVSGAGMLVRTHAKLQDVDTGLGRTDAVTARLDLPRAGYTTPEARNTFFMRLQERITALPGVRDAALTSQLPFSGEYQASAMAVEHVTTDPNDLPMFVHRRVTPDFFAAAGIPVVRGALFDANAPGDVVLVDETTAQTFWPGQDPIGRRIGRPWLNEMLTVTGVVGAVLDGELAGRAEPTVYTPLVQDPPTSVFLVIGTTAGTTVLPGMRMALRELDPFVPLSDARTLDQLVQESLRAQRLATTLLSLFGAAALVLAAIGIYGVLAYTAGRRTREFAVRLALGATARDVAALILREGATLTLAGAAIGTVAAFALGRMVQSLLHETAPSEPSILLAVAALTLATAGAAAVVPALRASRTQPAQVMKE